MGFNRKQVTEIVKEVLSRQDEKEVIKIDTMINEAMDNQDIKLSNIILKRTVKGEIQDIKTRALIIKDLAVHKGVAYSGLYTLSQINTGRAVCHFFKKRDAINAAKELQDLFSFDFEEEFINTDEYRTGMQPVIEKVHEYRRDKKAY